MSGTQVLWLTLQGLATGAMVGIIWFVQLVHYPLFAAVGPDAFVAYETDNTRRTAWVVGPAMLLESIAALALAIAPPPGVADGLAWTGIALLVLIHASTGLVQVPAHRVLSARWDPAAGRRLVQTNWVRTALWSARGALALAMLIGALAPSGLAHRI